MKAPLGSIPELPASSCQEIKASEGKDTISSKYWLDTTGNGTAVLVYCDMDLEGYLQSYNLCIVTLNSLFEDVFRIICYLDVDECITGNHGCDVNANCTNTVGGHNCTCKKGFAGDGRSCLGKLSFRLHQPK